MPEEIELFTKKDGVIGYLYPETFEIELNLDHEDKLVPIINQLSKKFGAIKENKQSGVSKNGI